MGLFVTEADACKFDELALGKVGRMDGDQESCFTLGIAETFQVRDSFSSMERSNR